MKPALVASAFVWLVCSLLSSSTACAQGVGASGEIVGTVTDPSGAIIPRVSVVAVEVARGTQYTATTGDSGQYRLTGLLPAVYNVTAQVAGFETMTQKSVVVNVGETSILDFNLKLATAGQSVEVTAAPPVVVLRGLWADRRQPAHRSSADQLPAGDRAFGTARQLPGRVQRPAQRDHHFPAAHRFSDGQILLPQSVSGPGGFFDSGCGPGQ